MSETIKTSKKGIVYKDYVLKCKSRACSKAVLMKIPHNDPDNIDISLKLGRYKLIGGSLDIKNPKSELTLDNDELNSLITYLSKNYKPITLGKGEYISVESEQAKLLEQLKNAFDGKEGVANAIIESGILTSDVYYAVNVINRKNALEEFENMLSQDLPESDWQSWFENNKWILGSDFVRIIDDRRIDTTNIADYLMQSFDGFLDIVEIKKPNNMAFWSTVKDHNNYVPSLTLLKAITQCLNYIYAVEQKTNDASFREQIECKVIKPRCTLIFGRSNDWDDEQMEAFRILNSAYSQISIMTYDQLLDRAKNVLGIFDEYEEIVEDDDLPF